MCKLAELNVSDDSEHHLLSGAGCHSAAAAALDVQAVRLFKSTVYILIEAT